MAYVAVDKDMEEYIYDRLPSREADCWVNINTGVVDIPKGSIEKLIGRKLTWEDDPVELKEETR